jgi:cysteine desulfuration protein SufE
MTLPTRLQRIVDLFRSAPPDLRVQALLDYSQRVPPLPAELDSDRDRLEQVHECVTQFFLATELNDDGTVDIYFDCPPESPTVRGYAGILLEGLGGEPASEILAVPNDFYMDMGLADVVTPQRLRGMGAIISRLKAQIRERA